MSNNQVENVYCILHGITYNNWICIQRKDFLWNILILTLLPIFNSVLWVSILLLVFLCMHLIQNIISLKIKNRCGKHSCKSWIVQIFGFWQIFHLMLINFEVFHYVQISELSQSKWLCINCFNREMEFVFSNVQNN